VAPSVPYVLVDTYGIFCQLVVSPGDSPSFFGLPSFFACRSSQTLPTRPGRGMLTGRLDEVERRRRLIEVLADSHPEVAAPPAEAAASWCAPVPEAAAPLPRISVTVTRLRDFGPGRGRGLNQSRQWP